MSLERTYNSEDLLQDLNKAGIRQDDILVVHSSLKSIGKVAGSAKAVIQALCDGVGNHGAVLFPCFTFSGSVTEYLRNINSVDLRCSSICTGIIPDTAWHSKEAYRSIHPTHPVAGFGEKTKILLQGTQSGQGPLGTDSPFYKAANSGCKILMIGVSLETCSMLHCAEEIAAPYIFCGETFDVRTVDFDSIVHNIKVKGYCVNVYRDFNSIKNTLIKEGIMEVRDFGSAKMLVIDAMAMINQVVEWIKKDNSLLLKYNKDSCPK